MFFEVYLKKNIEEKHLKILSIVKLYQWTKHEKCL